MINEALGLAFTSNEFKLGFVEITSVLILVAYSAIYFYECGFYWSLYKPTVRDSTLKYSLEHVSLGLILVSFTSVFIIMLTLLYFWIKGFDKNSLIPILAVELILIFIDLILVISWIIGYLMKLLMIKISKMKKQIITSQGEEISVKMIYAEDEIFLYYMKMDGTGDSIRKDDIKSITSI